MVSETSLRQGVPDLKPGCGGAARRPDIITM